MRTVKHFSGEKTKFNTFSEKKMPIVDRVDRMLLESRHCRFSIRFSAQAPDFSSKTS